MRVCSTKESGHWVAACPPAVRRPAGAGGRRRLLCDRPHRPGELVPTGAGAAATGGLAPGAHQQREDTPGTGGAQAGGSHGRALLGVAPTCWVGGLGGTTGAAAVLLCCVWLRTSCMQHEWGGRGVECALLVGRCPASQVSWWLHLSFMPRMLETPTSPHPSWPPPTPPRRLAVVCTAARCACWPGRSRSA